MDAPLTMEERILNLTLDIIQLLDGEDYIGLKIANETASLEIHKSSHSRLKPPSHSPTSFKKVLEVINKMADLLAAESANPRAGPAQVKEEVKEEATGLEEWENLRLHKDLYNINVVDDQLPLTSLGGAEEHGGAIPSDEVEKFDSSERNPIPSGAAKDDIASCFSEYNSVTADGAPSPPGLSADTSWGPYPLPPITRRTDLGVPETLTCPECGDCFATTAQLAEHHAGHADEKPYLCSVCRKCFPSLDLLTLHQISHTQDRSPSRRRALAATRRRSHAKENSFPCSECGKCFSKRWALVSHHRTHTGEKPFCCSECGRCFTQKSHLVTHLRTHTGEKPYSCSECGRGFSEKQHVIQHQRSHTGDKPFPCPTCGKHFSQKQHLRKHQRSHTGEKPYSCSACGKCFSRKHYLSQHQRSHTGEKPFSCSECGKCFTRRAYLIFHLRSHTGEKPYSCPVCGKCYTRRAHVVLHLKTHVEETPPPCAL